MGLIMNSPGLSVTRVAKVDSPIVSDKTSFTLKRFLSQINSFYFISEIQEARRVMLTALTASTDRHGNLRAAILRRCRTHHLYRVKRCLNRGKGSMNVGAIFFLLAIIAESSTAFLTVMPAMNHLRAPEAAFLGPRYIRKSLFRDDPKQCLTMCRRVGV